MIAHLDRKHETMYHECCTSWFTRVCGKKTLNHFYNPKYMYALYRHKFVLFCFCLSLLKGTESRVPSPFTLYSLQYQYIGNQTSTLCSLEFPPLSLCTVYIGNQTTMVAIVNTNWLLGHFLQFF